MSRNNFETLKLPRVGRHSRVGTPQTAIIAGGGLAGVAAAVVLAEAEIPKAMAEAFRSGNLGIMDYYRMRNIQADTDMRKGIGGEEKPTKD